MDNMALNIVSADLSGTTVVPRGRRIARQRRPANDQRSVHQTQYDATVADFFARMNGETGRLSLYSGYFTGHLSASGIDKLPEEQRIAADFGCGNGWLAKTLPNIGFKRVYGFDTSVAMLATARAATPSTLLGSGAVTYHQTVPQSLRGKCAFVAAVHVHYHFPTAEELQTNFFGAIADMLADDGEAVIIGCPSEFIRRTPKHYQNSIKAKDVPESVRVRSSDLTTLEDRDGFIPLRDLPSFNTMGGNYLKDGTQMKVVFETPGARGGVERITLTDTYWSDKALIDIAKKAGLVFKRPVVDISWSPANPSDPEPCYPHAYGAYHFRKALQRSAEV